MKHCIRCRREMRDFADICPYCGAEQKNDFLLALPEGTIVRNRYRIGKVIGRGGTAITYQVYDQNLGRISALKEYFPAEIANRIPGSREVILYAGKRAAEYAHGFSRFLEEAQNMMKFHNHPNIIHVQDYFEENKTAYIVMEYLRGKTLKEEIEEHLLPYDRAVEIGVTVCSALTDMHKRKILHRDISPDNIFLCSDGTVKLIDFGAARFAAEELQKLTITYKGGFTPPEQYSQTEEQGAWGDIYALASTLYMAISGIRPEDSREREVRDEVKPLHTVCPYVPEKISEAIERAMSIEKDFRPRSAAEFADALKQHGKNKSLEEIKKRRKKIVIISLSITFSVLFITMSVFLIMWLRRIDQTTLPDAELSIWYTTDDQMSELAGQKMTAMTAAVQLFQKKYPNVDIRLMAVSEAEYAKKLKEAEKKGDIPDIFEYIPGTDSLTINESAVQKVVEYMNADTYFGSNDFLSAKYIYTGYNIPLLYRTDSDIQTEMFSAGNTEVFSWIRSEGFPVGMAANSRDIYSQIFQMEIPALETLTISDTAADLLVNGDISIYYSDTSEYVRVQKLLAGKYTVHEMTCDPVYCEPANRWSIADEITGKEEECAIRFLQFLLSDDGQECLYIQNQYPAIPAKDSIRNVYQALYTELADIIRNTHNKLK